MFVVKNHFRVISLKSGMRNISAQKFRVKSETKKEDLREKKVTRYNFKIQSHNKIKLLKY